MKTAESADAAMMEAGRDAQRERERQQLWVDHRFGGLGNIGNLSYAGLAALKNDLPILDTFIEFLLAEEATKTKAGKPRKGPLHLLITKERAEACYAEAQRRHGRI